LLAFVVKDWAKLHLKIKIPSKLYPLLIAIFHLKSEDLVMNGYWPWWFLGTVSYKQTCWLLLGTKIVAWNFYLLFKLGQDCFAEVCIFLFPYFCTYCMNVSHTILAISNTFNKQNPNIVSIIQTGNLKLFASGYHISPVGHQKAA